MGTFKRTPFEIDTTIKNGSKYLNQMQFNGIVQNNNTYDVDQNSLTDALNVYVNDQNTLVSREPLIKDSIEIDYPSETAQLIDIKECNRVKVFEFKDNEKYTIMAYKDETKYILSNLSNYQITIFDKYIIAWTDLGHKVINTNSYTKWSDLKNFVDIPVTKIITGSDVEERPDNLFTDGYEEHYVITKEISTVLPEKTVSKYSGEYLTRDKKYEITNISKPWKLTNYRILRPLNLEVKLDSLSTVSISKDETIVIGLDTYFLISFNGGITFTKVTYPITSIYAAEIKQVSEDGDAFFVKIDKQLWRCSLGDFTWTRLTSSLPGAYYCGVFKHADRFAIRCRYGNTTQFSIIYKYSASDSLTTVTSDTTIVTGGSYVSSENAYDDRAINMNDSYIVFTFKTANGQMSIGTIYSVQTTDSNYEPTIFAFDTGLSFDTYENAMTVRNVSLLDSKINFEGEVGLVNGGCYHYTGNITITDGQPAELSVSTDEYILSTQFPVLINGNVYVNTNRYGVYVFDEDSGYDIANLDGEDIVGGGSNYEIITSTSYTNSNYIVFNKATFTIYTNILADKDTLIIKYIQNGSSNYIDKVGVPSLSYSGSELFLAFDNEIMITKNSRDGSNILFSLPKINNQSFANNIKSIINISTTELAIFFENSITICSQVSDDTYGYRYNYAKTRLTLGTKFGNSVINTADGASTLYATPRGLAIMNYQAYMATTDQTLQFISDKIYAIWNKFYLSSENITLVQHGDYVFIYNTTNQYLMLDLRNYSWWKFEIPFNIKKILTDQIDLRIISDNLYKFKKISNNTDKIEDDYVDDKYYDEGNEPINWRFLSQRLHFNLPNHYKNMKQLVFHLVQSTGHISTFNAQIKLYRNSVNYKDMEVIPFDFNVAVDEFRTFVKRFNYWKINMLQYGVANDDRAAVPARLVCNGIDIKYEIGDEVR